MTDGTFFPTGGSRPLPERPGEKTTVVVGGKHYRLSRRKIGGAFYVFIRVKGRRYAKAFGHDLLTAKHRAIEFIIEHLPPEIGSEIPPAAVLCQTYGVSFAPLEVLPSPAPIPGSTLQDVFDVYDRVNTVGRRTAQNNKLALLKVFEFADGARINPAQTPLTRLDGHLIREYQSRYLDRRLAEAPKDVGAQRETKEKALRTSRGTVNQARCVFHARDADLLHLYREAMIVIPPTVQEFLEAHVRGRVLRRDYEAAPDEVLHRTFREIEKMRERDPDIFKFFWLASGCGLRASEALRADWSHVVIRDGRWHLDGGVGKNAQRIRVAFQRRAQVALEPFREPAGPILNPRGDLYKRFSMWIRLQGFTTAKTTHELRCYTGSLLYMQDPLAAKAFCRHGSISVTERSYSRYVRQGQTIDVL